MILVTGATGSVGGALIAQLVAADVPVRAMTRRPGALAAPPGVEVVAGDAEDPDSLDAAFAGAGAAFLMSAQPVDSAPHPTHDLALVDAARRAGLSRVVKLSVLSGGDGDDVIARWHAEAEHAVTSSGLQWTLLRPGRFHTNALRWAPMLHRGDTVHVPFAHRAAASIDPADIAAVAALALTTDDLLGAAPLLTGPESLTPTTEVAVLADVLARDLEVVEVGDERARDGMLRSGISARAADAAIARTHGTDGSEVLPTVADVLGRAPRPFLAWSTEHAPAFHRDDG